ncbi:MAG: Fe-Mn family superoxide dismutase [Candidatus Babeliales bacterium]
MKYTYTTLIIIATASISAFATYTIMHNATSTQQPCTAVFTHTAPRAAYSTTDAHGVYQTRPFDLAASGIQLTPKQIDEHLVLYKKYVDKRNEIARTLQSVDKKALSKTFSAFRSLKVAETYAVNGQILHELYFENIGAAAQPMGPLATALITDSFGSIEAFKTDILACGQVARGWVLCAFSLDDGKLHNFVLEEHNSHVPVMALPMLVFDVYEHAYFMDYGTALAPYLEQLWNHINWAVVEQRIETLVTPFNNNARASWTNT